MSAEWDSALDPREGYDDVWCLLKFFVAKSSHEDMIRMGGFVPNIDQTTLIP